LFKAVRTCGAELLFAIELELEIGSSAVGSTAFVLVVFAAVDTGFSEEFLRRTEYAPNITKTRAATVPKAKQFGVQLRVGVGTSSRAARTRGRREAGTSALALA